MNAVVIRRVTVTPAMARKWLEGRGNVRNRVHRSKMTPAAWAAIEKYARDMRAGTFETMNGQVIGFSHADVLVDGHHRLMAQVLAKVTLVWMVARNVVPKGIDGARARSTAEEASMNGKSALTKKVLAAISYVWQLEAGVAQNGPLTLSRHETIEHCRVFSKELDWLRNNHVESPGPAITREMIATLAWISTISPAYRQKASAFLEELRMKGAMSAAAANLRRALTEKPKDQNGDEMRGRALGYRRAQQTANAFAQYRDGVALSKVKATDGGLEDFAKERLSAGCAKAPKIKGFDETFFTLFPQEKSA